MDYQWIVFYISSHGFGHMTRCLAIIEEILKNKNYMIYIACGKLQNDFAKIYLANYFDRIIFNDMQTDVGLVNIHNSLKVDTNQLEMELLKFIDSWEEMVDKESIFLNDLNIKCVISDISPIGPLVGKKLNARIIGISNFTWVEQYEGLNVQQHITEKFKLAYSKLESFIEYELAMQMKDIKVPKSKIGFISRKIDFQKVKEINKKYGKSIFVTCGKSVSLQNIRIENYDGCIFTTSGVEIISRGNVVELPINTLDIQNYIAASTAVITKAGWGTISETVIAKSKLILIERDDIVEDSHNIAELKNRNLAISIKESVLSNIDMSIIEKEINKNIDMIKLNMYKNQTVDLVKLLGL